MNTETEPLSAILAEMKRRADEAHDGLNGVADTNQIDYMEVEGWAARIKEAVARERDALVALAEDCDYMQLVIRLAGVPSAIAGEASQVQTFYEVLDEIKERTDSARAALGEDKP